MEKRKKNNFIWYKYWIKIKWLLMKISEFSRQRPQPNNNIVVQEDAKVTTERKVNEEAQASDSTSHSSVFSKKILNI